MEAEAEAGWKLSLVKRANAEEPAASLDLISALPDEMLHIIIALVPTKSVVCTTVLSKWWRHLWCSVPLDLTVDHNLARQESKCLAAISKILAAHPGPVRRLSIDIFATKWDLTTRFVKWFPSSTLDGLEELKFQGRISGPRSMLQSVLRFVPTLRILHLWHCELDKIVDAPGLSFPLLKLLELYDIYISAVGIHYILACCTVLEDLRLQGIYGVKTLTILSPNLQCVSFMPVSSRTWNLCYIAEEHFLDELTILHGPSLEILIAFAPESPVSMKVFSAPKLICMAYMPSQSWELLIGAIPGNIPISNQLLGHMQFVTTSFTVQDDLDASLDGTIEFVKCFYSTEKRYMQSEFVDIDQDVLDRISYNISRCQG